ncbi:MAG: hypothetical protein RR203_07895 [Synergistaceae bacterium]
MNLWVMGFLILGGLFTVAVVFNAFIDAGEDAKWIEYLQELERRGAKSGECKRDSHS